MKTKKSKKGAKPKSINVAKAMKALRKRLGDRVAEDDNSRFNASLDNLRLSVLPHAVIQVQAADEVAVVLKLANKYGVPLTCRGAGTSATGSAVPIHGGWVLDLSALNRIEINPVARIATVGAGVVTADLQAQVEALGLFFPPDPSSKKYSTLGGNIACNAGGMRCVKYGVTRDYVLGLEGVLADGSPFQFGLPLKKYVSGLNLRDLLIGSEGTLGVITAANLKLIPKPEKRWTGMFAFKSEAAALKAVVGLFQAGVNPSILEFLDRQSVGCAERYTGKKIFEGQPRSSILLIELDGCSVEVREQRKRLLEYMLEVAAAYREARSELQAEKLWQVRRTCSQSMFSIADTKLNEDVVVPIEKQAELIRYTLALKKEIGLATPTFGHAGDGNLHVHIMYNRASQSDAEKAQAGIEKLMQKVVDLGGVITGEHGIGLAKSPFMAMQHTAPEIAVMRSVKQALDPLGILNPGKIFDPFEVWDHELVDVTLPWDHR
ncbi:FAD-binding oxidoreductase [Coraliomargarita sp. SDUM461004]|uniref:FAD-binding oxidoreductase n=1 Tax=Thalassobacterium sedimentorum TaxID=3041258 RepID=A0ABU1AMD8_9BACT|nr:FAD-binding oxidoreductase [Coraliomargarita sp. SDUM461004]MDQ8195378.1 FAD-binding oxidoreductase [Coraliomargarita sp. SDUM461004]